MYLRHPQIGDFTKKWITSVLRTISGLIRMPLLNSKPTLSADGALQSIPHLFRQIHHPRDLGPVRAGIDSLSPPEHKGGLEIALLDQHPHAFCGFIRLAGG